MIKDLDFECPIVSFIKVYDSIFYSLLTSEIMDYMGPLAILASII